MADYIVQYRLIRLQRKDQPPDQWSSATSTMTVVEASAPFEADDDQAAEDRVPEVVMRLAQNKPDIRIMLQEQGLDEQISARLDNSRPELLARFKAGDISVLQEIFEVGLGTKIRVDETENPGWDTFECTIRKKPSRIRERMFDGLEEP